METALTSSKEREVQEIIHRYLSEEFFPEHHKAMAKVVEEILVDELLKNRSFGECRFSSRVFDRDTLMNKLLSKGGHYKDFDEIKNDLTDVVSVRVIVQNQADELLVNEVIEQLWGDGVILKSHLFRLADLHLALRDSIWLYNEYEETTDNLQGDLLVERPGEPLTKRISRKDIVWPNASMHNITLGKAGKVNWACVHCRRSHMICDRERPCGRCITSNIGHLCHYEPQHNPRRFDTDVPNSLAGIASSVDGAISEYELRRVRIRTTIYQVSMESIRSKLPKEYYEWKDRDQMEIEVAPAISWAQIEAFYDGTYKSQGELHGENFDSRYEHAKKDVSGDIVSRDSLPGLFELGKTIVMAKDQTWVAGVVTEIFRRAPTEGQPDWGNESPDFLSYGVRYWSYAYDGSFYQEKHETTVHLLNGKTKIRELTAYPLRYASAEVKTILAQRCHIMWKCRHRRLVSYAGDGDPSEDDERYMIDYATYKQMHPDSATVKEKSVDSSGKRMSAKAMEADEPPAHANPYVFPSNIVGYSLRSKKWVSLKVHQIRDVLWKTQIFDRLVLPLEQKDIIHALIYQNLNIQEGIEIIKKSSENMVMLFHGPPGTGKTLTAESIAELAEKPLYRITSGDVGFTPEEVGKYLETVFYFGRIWGCVVLLDEAEVFLDERTSSDLSRHALVSVFLRTLEHYEGILIMTTSRAGTIDEAFKSRIHLSLRYETLSVSSREKIWRNFFQYLEETDLDNINSKDILKSLRDLAQYQLNGRQIRNAITTARQLAKFRGTALDTSHLKKAIEVANDFDQYLRERGHGEAVEKVSRSKKVKIELPPSTLKSHASQSSCVDMDTNETVTHDTLPTTISSRMSAYSNKGAFESFSEDADPTPLHEKPAYTSPVPRTNIAGGYVRDFTRLIIKATSARNMTQLEIARVCNVLPLYMTAYAQKLGHIAAQLGENRPEIPFIHEHLHKFASKLEDIEQSDASLDDDNELHERAPDPLLVSNAETRAQEWIEALTENPTFDHWDPKDDALAAFGPGTEQYEPDAMHEVALHDIDHSSSKSPAFKWLISMIKREQSLDTGGLLRMRKFSEGVLHHLPPELEISRRKSQLYRVRYILQWDLLSFIKQQRYNEPTEQVIEAVIVLTGNMGKAQATTCGEYLKQTWPTTGGLILNLLIDVAREARAECTFPDHTELSASSKGSEFVLEAYGTRFAVAEISEQLAWLSSAFRSSGDDYSATFGVSLLKHVRDTHDAPDSEPTHIFSIDTVLERIDASLYSLPGHCWYSMFRAPVLVLNFPIPVRPHDQVGLEMPLSMMAKLVDADSVQEFNRTLFIKGFSSMLYLTKTTEQIMTWHHEFDASGGYLSYSNPTAKLLDNISVASIGLRRHIVGWSSEVKNCTGTSEAIFESIARSRLQEPPAYARIEKFGVSGGKYISASISIAVGLRDKPLHIVAESYFQRINELRNKFVVLWDTSENRGWLVQGTHALLHLVRKSLSVYESDQELVNHYLYGSEGYPEMQQKDTPLATLLDRANLRLIVYHGGEEIKYDREGDKEAIEKESSSYFRLEHLVKELLDRLEKMNAYQILAARDDGYQIPEGNIHSNFMQGWDFYLTARRDSLIRRLESEIPSQGKGWPDLVRDMSATILFGTGFGEIIRPATASVSCTHNWSTLPKGQCLLAVTVQDLRRIIEEYGGDESATPIKLTRKLALDSPRENCQDCTCLEQPQVKPGLFKRFLSRKKRQLTYCNLSHCSIDVQSRKWPACRSDLALLPGQGAIALRHNPSDVFRPKNIPKRVRNGGSTSTTHTVINSSLNVPPVTDATATPSTELTLASSDQSRRHENDTPATTVGTLTDRHAKNDDSSQ